MNVNNVKTEGYGDKSPLSPPKNEPKTNPNEPNLKNAKTNVISAKIRDYENKRLFALRPNEPNSNPIKPNFKSKKEMILPGMKKKRIKNPEFTQYENTSVDKRKAF